MEALRAAAPKVPVDFPLYVANSPWALSSMIGTMAVRDLADGVHLAADTGVVDWDDRLRAFVINDSSSGLVQVHRVWADVGEYDFAPRSAKAFAVETNVNDGTMTSSRA